MIEPHNSLGGEFFDRMIAEQKARDIGDAESLLLREGWIVRRPDSVQLPFEARWSGSFDQPPFCKDGQFFILVGDRTIRAEQRFEAKDAGRFPAHVIAQPLVNGVSKLVVADLLPKFAKTLFGAGVGTK